MKTLMRIVFIIFIVNGIDCLGGVCDNCCDCFKEKEEDKKEEIKEYKEIKEDENNTAKSLVNKDWYKAKENIVLKIFKKEDDNGICTSEGDGDKISFKLDEKDNSKIAYLQKKVDEDPLNLGGEKYALFEIKTQEEENTVYLYCSDVESIGANHGGHGIFQKTNHVNISVIACDTTKVTDMKYMFFACESLTELDLTNFNTENVTDMASMFSFCSSLEKLKFGENFNTTNVTNMFYMFYRCSSLVNLELGDNFNTTKVKNKKLMFFECNNLSEGIKAKY